MILLCLTAKGFSFCAVNSGAFEEEGSVEDAGLVADIISEKKRIIKFLPEQHRKLTHYDILALGLHNKSDFITDQEDPKPWDLIVIQS